MLKPIGMMAAGGLIGLILTKLLVMLALPLLGMFIGFMFMIF